LVSGGVAGHQSTADASAEAERTVFGSLIHFYSSTAWQAWACDPAHHASKFGDLSSWKSYKQPLKGYIAAVR
jgi:hypothetical protein